ncbi:hypothetical protein LQ236_000765 [Nitrospina gracilis]|uniref:OprD family outer membrane porin n=2 Tax=Nitrospina TaxID=35800 RepID=UPI001F37B18F|nr:OprD family outer membrane porin [Nitrospina sp. Nb-3]MCF8722745.1 hypothetical protein [Nitrospina sp. Nb-3]
MALAFALALAAPHPVRAADADLPAFFRDSTLRGNVRAYFQSRDFATRPYSSVASVGGRLVWHTGETHGFSGRVGFYTANGFALSGDGDPPSNGALTVDNNAVFAEAFLQYQSGATRLRAGRQTVNTPFINPADAFMIPFHVEGLAFRHTLPMDVTLHAIHLDKVKNRQEDQFDDAGAFVTGRLTGTPAQTDGVSVLGADWRRKHMRLQVWEYWFWDLFHLFFVQGEVTLLPDADVRPFLKFQFGREDDVQAAFLGTVRSTLYGAQAGVEGYGALFRVGWNYIPTEPGTFRSGSFLSPYNFSTDALFTNSMMQGLTVKPTVQAGWAVKATALYRYGEQWMVKLSHAHYDLPEEVGGADSAETNFDIRYRFQEMLKGFSVRYRFGVITADRADERFADHRVQLQYAFTIFE